MPLLEARHLRVSYGSLIAVRDIDFHLDEGEVVALIGSNGAGKSSTLNGVIGLLDGVGGQLSYDGRNIMGLRAEARIRLGLGMSPEGRRLFGHMTVLENLLVGATTTRDRATVKRRITEVCRIFPRVEERLGQQAGSLSGGEQQMVAIGRALMSGPRLLLLDEPSLGIAPKVVGEIAGAIKALREVHGVSILLVEQNSKLALTLADRAYVLERGSIVKEGMGRNLLTDPMIMRSYLGVRDG